MSANQVTHTVTNKGGRLIKVTHYDDGASFMDLDGRMPFISLAAGDVEALVAALQDRTIPHRPLAVGDVLYVTEDYTRTVVWVDKDMDRVVSVDSDDGMVYEQVVKEALADRDDAEGMA